MKPHPHAEFIKAWADGAAIQYEDEPGKWLDDRDPGWHTDVHYRIKPAEPERVYPVTTMTGDELMKAARADSSAYPSKIRANIANAALRHAIDAGQVVTREEFNKLASNVSDAYSKAFDLTTALEDARLKRDARDMAVAMVVRSAGAARVTDFQMRHRVLDMDLAAILAEVKP